MLRREGGEISNGEKLAENEAKKGNQTTEEEQKEVSYCGIAIREHF